MTPFLALSLLLAQGGFDARSQWDEIARSIRGRYYARNTQAEKMNRLLTKYAPICAGAASLTQFEDDVNRMIGEFGDSHFELFTRRDQGYYLMDGLTKALTNGVAPVSMPNIGAWFRKGPNGYVVQMVIDGTPASRAGLRVGDVVTRVDGQPFTPIEALQSLVGKSVRLDIQRGNSAISGTVDVVSGSGIDMFLQGSRDSARVIESNGKKFGYFHLWTQASPKFAEALEIALQGRLRQTDAMILDLRDGFGGRPEKMADPFFRPEVQLDWDLGGSISRQSFGYQRPLVVLINRGSRSAKEVLSFILKKAKRAVLIGTRTAGNVLGTFPQQLGNWGYLEIPMVDLKTDGVRLEGVGVEPDVVVSPEYSSDGRDLVLERAVQFLGSKVGGQ